MLDWIIKNGWCYDGLGNPPMVADIAVQGDRIVRVGPGIDAPARAVYDAQGKAVIPGLIDPHVHEEWVCLVDGRYELFLRQGVTTVINGNCGHSILPGPLENIIAYYFGNGLMSERQRDVYAGRFPRWDDFEGYARAVAAKGTNLNLVTLLGHGTIRWTVMQGAHPRKPDAGEAARIEAIIRQGMDQGMFGLSFGLDYVPSRYADIDELCAMTALIKDYGGVCVAHLRHYAGIEQATAEYVQVGRRTGAKLQFSHLPSAVPAAFDLVRDAVEREGLPLRVDTIPESCGHCVSKSRLIQFIMAVSDTLFAQGMDGVRRALHDPQGREVIRKEAYILGKNPRAVYIVRSQDAALENRSVADIAADRGADPFECLLDLIGDDRDYTFWLNAPGANLPDMFVPHCESIVHNPYVSVGSDEILGDIEQPFDWYEVRRRGAFPLFARQYLDKGVPYEEIVRRNTSMVADHFGIAGRGRLCAGGYADVAVIDLQRYGFPPLRQQDYRTPQRMAEGCELVLVNGAPALRDGRVETVYAGRVLRRGQL
ncbi:MAG: amidohydrolase family protein [Oscillospiraceae bacterium]|jgi:N-acyl-D-aspartate/D-glutamate deacylase|nr:amidohydrolase family protein [Oscillospiraceae bacterium]